MTAMSRRGPAQWISLLREPAHARRVVAERGVQVSQVLARVVHELPGGAVSLVSHVCARADSALERCPVELVAPEGVSAGE